MEKEVKKDPKKQVLLEPVEGVLQSMGYQSGEAPIKKQFITKPEYYGTRENCIIAIYVVPDIKTLNADIPRLKLVRLQMGKGLDYVLLIPSCDTNALIDIMRANEEKNYKIVMREGFIVWIWDSANKEIMSYFNLPSDKVLQAQIENKGDIVAK